MDGRIVDPLSSSASFDNANRVTFSGYNGMNPNGTWALFVADVSKGGGTSVLEGWSLDITAVPEPAGTALIVFGFALAAFQFVNYWRRKRVKRQEVQ